MTDVPLFRSRREAILESEDGSAYRRLAAHVPTHDGWLVPAVLDSDGTAAAGPG